MIKGLLTLFIILFLQGISLAFVVQETENSTFSIETYLRTDVVSWKNVATLDSHNKDDSTTYFGIDYSIGFKSEFKDGGPQFYLKLERNGPYDYDAPLFIHNTLMVQGDSHIEAYRNEELLPQVEEFWSDFSIPKTALRLKAGLISYDVGKGYVQGSGSYENYGVCIYKPGDDFSWRFHYYRPDLVYKNRLGPRIKQEEEQWIGYEPNAANYFALDAEAKYKEHVFTPFVGLLTDYTSSGKRVNLFAVPVHKEVLGTFGFDYDLKLQDFSFGLEAARNFGQAESTDPDFKDIRHKGYLVYARSDYALGKLTPRAQFLYSSGNKVTPDMVENGDLLYPGSTNRAFSVYSPTNLNLLDSHGPAADSLPLVFFGWGYGLNYGVGCYRPSTLCDVAVLENLIMPSLGLDYSLNEKTKFSFDWWYMRANEAGFGMLGGLPKELSKDLGHEVDLTVSYDLNKHANISFSGGYFFPGKYFKEERDDTEGSLLSPYVRGDGRADGAYQFELSMEFNF